MTILRLKRWAMVGVLVSGASWMTACEQRHDRDAFTGVPERRGSSASANPATERQTAIRPSGQQGPSDLQNPGAAARPDILGGTQSPSNAATQGLDPTDVGDARGSPTELSGTAKSVGPGTTGTGSGPGSASGTGTGGAGDAGTLAADAGLRPNGH